MARFSRVGLVLAALLFVDGCGGSDDSCQTTQCPGGSYRFCTGASTCEFRASDGNVFTCNSCSDCLQAAAAVDAWCRTGATPTPEPNGSLPDGGTFTSPTPNGATGTGSMSCDACFSTAQGLTGACTVQAQKCGADPACVQLNDCMNACTTQACSDACAQMAPTSARQETLAIYQCVCTTACKSECTSFCAPIVASAGSTDSGASHVDGGAPVPDAGTPAADAGAPSTACGIGAGSASGTVSGMTINVKSARAHVDANGILGAYLWDKTQPVGTVNPVEGDLMLSVGVRGTPPCETMYICSSDYTIPTYGVVAFWRFTSGAWQVAANAQLGSVSVSAKVLPPTGQCGGRFAGSFMALFSANQPLGGTFDAPISP
jgi:hypothetical protein